jgi:septal ring factor EnvC (AmiA/AmiB activator)
MALMKALLRRLSTASRPALVAALGLVPFAGADAQPSGRAPGEVPYLNFPPVAIPASPTTEAKGSPPVGLPTVSPPPITVAKPATGAPADPATTTTSALPAPVTDTLKQRDLELTAIRSDQARAVENEAKLKRDIASIGDDRRKLNQQLIETTGRIRTLEEAVAKTEERLQPLDRREQTLRESLEARRGVIIDVLAALQRIGRHPPPALFVRPEDALQSLRSAMLLGAVLPEMRQETEALLTDIGELTRVRAGIAEERGRLTRDLASLADDTPRLTALIEQRQKQMSEAEQSLAGERQRALQLARQADTLQDLIGTMEQQVESVKRTAAVAARPLPERGGRTDLSALKDPGRLAPAMAFASAKGLLPLPVSGSKLKNFGASDGLGGSERGITIAARTGTPVTAPCDGWVVYAGPFRNYGQLLILNAGGGYHVLLAGMERITVDLGQFVVTGEPVAVMGSRAQVAAAGAVGSKQPVLYVEFRKDGTPVDPSPWWAASEGEKVRG